MRGIDGTATDLPSFFWPFGNLLRWHLSDFGRANRHDVGTESLPVVTLRYD